ncbi:MAG: DUF1080 domain-containing protein [Verrucomicrobia bacterium]|nr:DUF1080 domain-containing protein [Verrucomicrobiota bacterium]MCG2680516.1 DUF1080 domain-containing protein [Kiritimatiellia bacterium]MBU4248239.1 DUF1080 domain-containing protein [Verrucomicrobiota bacterium]MBU4290442.1 DUF1080 domain-containing protein [Verrucomicrobiota bacterium]MBU4428856.1 DUF1080 domain-containing protein [Verrucomicrobiota bacterium]
MTDNRPGYDDTPLIPGSNYKVHDKNRPQPRVVTPGTESTQDKAGQAPSDAVVLFDGADLSSWTGRAGPAQWKVQDGYMEVVPGTGNIKTRRHFGDCQLHIEWAAPGVVKGESQGRGNSGVFLMGIYEVQVLDCFNNPTYADGLTAALYGQCPPLVNACRNPGLWQTYDLIWLGPRFEGEKLVRPARITVLHNGIVAHHDKELICPTTHRAVQPYQSHAEIGPLALQDHGDLVRYRNIWYRPMTDYDQAVN